MRLLIISLAIIFGSCGSNSSKETDTETANRMKLEFIEQRLNVLQGELDSAKRPGADSNTLIIKSVLIKFLNDEKAKINAGK